MTGRRWRVRKGRHVWWVESPDLDAWPFTTWADAHAFAATAARGATA